MRCGDATEQANTSVTRPITAGVLETLCDKHLGPQHEKRLGEEHMVGELDVLNEWIPEQMQPGTVFVLENAGEIGEKEDPYWAVLSCPSCGMLGLITRKQINGLIPVICGSEQCSAQFFIRDAEVVVRKPF